MYDIFYIGENTSLKERLPFASQVNDVDSIKSNTRMYWIIDSNTKITNWEIFDFKPDTHTEKYQHIWKWNQENYGGVSLLPKRENTETVWHNKVVCKKYFDTLFEDAPGNYFAENPNSTHVWCVDSEYVLGEDIDWAPGNFEPDFIHSFHLRGQLEHKYPKQEGGVKLFPRDWESADTKYHKFLDTNVAYPVYYTKDVERYAQRNTFQTDYVWLVDAQYMPNLHTFDWVPNPFEADMIHAFKMPYQLQEKYPDAMGGIRLVPMAWSKAETKIHKACPVEDEAYDVFYVDEDEFTADTYSEYAERSKTEWFWIVDRDHMFNGKLLYVPSVHEREYIHVFKIPGHLEERYPLDVTDAWDNRCGGVRLVHKDFDITKHKHQEDICPVRYDIFYADDINDYETPARKSRTKMFWLVDSEHQINEDFKYVPQRYDQKCIQVFKFPNDLEHKYPRAVTNISDNRAGGIKLVPVNGNGDTKYNDQSPVGGKTYPIRFTDTSDEPLTEDSWIVPTAFEDAVSVIPWQPNVFEKNTQHVFANGLLKWMPVNWNGDVKEHDFTPIVMDIKFEKFESYELGLLLSSFNWFWVVDPDVTVLETFDFDFQPNVFDEGKSHVWQKLNPITNKQYDYGGVSLRHKDEKKGRPKYIREPACMQQEFPVYHVQPNELVGGLDGVYESLALQTSTSMMWVVDGAVALDTDFDFSYYPTHYDNDVVHVWEHEGSSRATGVRLLPTNIKYTSAEQIIENKFDRLKEMPKVASKEPTWPCEQLTDVTVAGVQKILDKHSDTHYVWTVDPDVEQDNDIIAESIIPHEQFIDSVHVWKTSVGAGGLRLWPTTYDTSNLTDEQVLTSSIPGQLIIDAVAGEHKDYAVCYLNSNSSLLEQINQFSDQCESNMFWVVDPHIELMADWTFDYVPNRWEGQVVHIWQHEGSSKHSGVKLMPKGTYSKQEVKENSYVKLKEITSVASKDPIWPIEQLESMTSKEIQGVLAKHNDVSYVWTVDPDIELDDNIIKQSIIPHTDNSLVVHVWKRTDNEGLVIGHGGLRLWPTSYDASQLSDDQVLTCSIPGQLILDAVAGEQKEYSICYLNNESAILEQINEYSSQCESNMFWAVDPYVELAKGWKFDYVPTKWEEHVVHIWQHEGSSKQSGVKLMPNRTYTKQEVKDNSYVKLKEIYNIASKDPIWPVEQLHDLTSEEVQAIIAKHKDVGYVWTVDPDIDLDADIIAQSIMPHTDNSNIVHVWKRTDSDGLVIGHGGIRLWPTSYDASQLSDEQVLTCSIPDQLILNATGGAQKEYPIFNLDAEEDILEQLADFDNRCESAMYWVVDPWVTVATDFKFDFIPTKWEEDAVHVFQDSNEDFRSIRLIPRGTFNLMQYDIKQIVNNSFNTLKQVYTVATLPTYWKQYTLNTDMGTHKQHLEHIQAENDDWFYTIDDDVQPLEQFVFAHTPQLDSLYKTHVWQRTNSRTGLTQSYGGVRLWPNPISSVMSEVTSEKIRLNKMDAGKLQYVKEPASIITPYAVFMLSYKEDESMVQAHIDVIQAKDGIDVVHVRGVEGIFNAHKACATQCNTKMFWVVDADALVSDDFNFEYIPDVYDQDVVHVWNSRNQVTGEEYGYGGVKLFNTQQVADATSWGLDFTTGLSKRFKSMPQVSCVTNFNVDAHSTWRSAFRECVKLTLSVDPDAQRRLSSWLHPQPDAQFVAEAEAGAEAGYQFALKNRDDPAVLNNINDYTWLETEWTKLKSISE